MFSKVISLLFVLQGAQCSMVIDGFGQKGIFVSDYCPHMKYCAEGAHVMCMYYDPNRTFGPRCSNPQNVTITPELANQLLDVINAIRSKIAYGKETGHNNTRLPRGYGIFRLRWDNELATFAQVFANQCMLRHDFCRATKRFPEPCQTAGLVRFPYPGWDPQLLPDTVSVLNDDKLSYSVMQILKSWYSQKTFVTDDMVQTHPTWESRPNTSGKLYLEIVRGAMTHMGCGMSAYTEFLYYHQNSPLNGRKGGQNYNSVEIICNFSSRTEPGQKTYWTTHPNNAYNSQCGCPEGSQEDADCLCNEVSAAREQKKAISVGVQAEPESCSNPDKNCEPTLVLLPIFTVEDAPPEKLIERARDIEEPLANYVMDRLDNRTNMMPRARSLEIFNFFEDADKEHQVAPMPHSLKTVLMAPEQEYVKLPKSPIKSLPLTLPTLSKKKYSPPRKEYLRAVPEPQPLAEPDPEPEPEPEPIPEPEQKPKHTYVPKTILHTPKHPSSGKKSSIFTRVAKFKLPNGRRKFGQYAPIKSDVRPRKDFKNIERVVNDYIKRRNNKMGYRRSEVVTSKHKESLKKVTIATTTLKLEETTEAILSKAEEKVINFNQYMKPKANMTTEDNTKHFDLKYEESDNKLMSLLDTLEREVKHIELDGDEKEIFDAKIRKIYGSVVGKPVDLLEPAKPKPKPKPDPPLPITSSPPPPVHNGDRESDFIESDFGETKAYVKYDSNHITQDNIRTRSELLSEDDKNPKKKARPDFIEHKHKDKLDRKYSKNTDDKYGDIYDNKSFNDNDMFDNDQRIFSDIERKYNDRLSRTFSMSNLDRKYDNENPDSKYGDNLGRKYDDVAERKHTSAPAPRNQNKLVKYDNLKHRASSGEERKHRVFDKYRERESRIGPPRDDNDRNYYRNGEDDRKLNPVNGKRGKASFNHNEFEHDDPMSSERRKFYQDKLENLERRLHSTRSYRRRKNDDRPNERPMRRMRPNVEHMDAVRSRSKAQGDSFYVPDRARFLHGF